MSKLLRIRIEEDESWDGLLSSLESMARSQVTIDSEGLDGIEVRNNPITVDSVNVSVLADNRQVLPHIEWMDESGPHLARIYEVGDQEVLVLPYGRKAVQTHRDLDGWEKNWRPNLGVGYVFPLTTREGSQPMNPKDLDYLVSRYGDKVTREPLAVEGITGKYGGLRIAASVRLLDISNPDDAPFARVVEETGVMSAPAIDYVGQVKGVGENYILVNRVKRVDGLVTSTHRVHRQVRRLAAGANNYVHEA